MSQLVTIPFRLTPQRERALREALNIPDDQPLRNVVAYYAIRDTVYAWLDGADVTLDADADDDLGEQRSFRVSERPYRKKLVIKKHKSGTPKKG